LNDAHSPLKAKDIGHLAFYQPDSNYRVTATVQLTPGSKPFEIATHSGKSKPYRKYGVATFRLKGKKCTLAIYQGLDLIKKPELKDYLFIPFNDLTNYETTYAGGRYLDLRIGDIRQGRVVVDFNKAYNPYCAFAEGYACPIPLDENKLQVRIEAGEQLFVKGR
jgi:uncharacterized protein (DUF1684 family)